MLLGVRSGARTRKAEVKYSLAPAGAGGMLFTCPISPGAFHSPILRTPHRPAADAYSEAAPDIRAMVIEV